MFAADERSRLIVNSTLARIIVLVLYIPALITLAIERRCLLLHYIARISLFVLEMLGPPLLRHERLTRSSGQRFFTFIAQTGLGVVVNNNTERHFIFV